MNTGRSGGDDATAVLAVAANARSALYDGGDYLLKQLSEQPATSSVLADAIRGLVKAYQQLAIDYMANAPDSEIKASQDAITRTGTTVYELCK